jgi:hypothetical protein
VFSYQTRNRYKKYSRSVQTFVRISSLRRARCGWMHHVRTLVHQSANFTRSSFFFISVPLCFQVTFCASWALRSSLCTKCFTHRYVDVRVSSPPWGWYFSLTYARYVGWLLSCLTSTDTVVCVLANEQGKLKVHQPDSRPWSFWAVSLTDWSTFWDGRRLKAL